MQKFLFIRTICFIFALIFTFSSCSTVKTTTSTNEPLKPALSMEKRTTQLQHIQNFAIKGKIAVVTAKDSGSASIDWVQQGAHYAISLLGPLGSHGMRLVGSTNHVRLTASDGKTYESNSPEKLLLERWGFDLPVLNMRYWIRGLKAPGSEAKTSYDSRHRLIALHQDNVTIQYLNYTQVGEAELPDKIFITSPQLKTKLMIYQWRLNA